MTVSGTPRGQSAVAGDDPLTSFIRRGVANDPNAVSRPNPVVAPRDRGLLVAVSVLVLLLVAFGYWRYPAIKESKASVQHGAPARADSSPAHAPADISIPGRFVADRLTQISATVLARVGEFRVSIGSTVRKGEIVAVLIPERGTNDIRMLEHRLTAQEQALGDARLARESARLEAARLSALRTQGYIPKKLADDGELAFERAQLQVSQAQAQMLAARDELEAMRRQQREYVIRAPFDGLVVDRVAQVGEVVSPGGMSGSVVRSGLLTLVDTDSIQVEVSVQERLLPQVRAAQCVLVTSLAEPDLVKGYPYRLARVSRMADRAGGTVVVILKPGAAAPAPILETTAEATFVPQGDPRCQARPPQRAAP